MVENKIRVLSFNVAKNFLLVDSLLNICVNNYDIIFLQEPAWQMIRMAPSSVSREGDDVVGAPRHPQWTMMVRPPTPGHAPRVMAYVSTRLAALRPAMRRDIFDHRDLLLVSLFGRGQTFNFLNVYNDADGTALTLLEERHTPVSLAYMGGDFNCHSSVWDRRVVHHHAAAISLLETASIMGLDLTQFENPGPTFISHNADLRPSVIDLIFVRSADSIAVRSTRMPGLRSLSDHVPISVTLDLDLDAPEILRFSIKRGSEEDYSFTGAIIAKVSELDRYPHTPGEVDSMAQALADVFDGPGRK